MTNKEFTIFAKKMIEECFETMGFANQEYASEGNKFDNFEGIAEFMRRFNPRLKDITDVDVGWIYRLKHIISEIKGVSLREDMHGRHVDDINYGLLIAGMMAQATKTPKNTNLPSWEDWASNVALFKMDGKGRIPDKIRNEQAVTDQY